VKMNPTMASPLEDGEERAAIPVGLRLQAVTATGTMTDEIGVTHRSIGRVSSAVAREYNPTASDPMNRPIKRLSAPRANANTIPTPVRSAPKRPSCRVPLCRTGLCGRHREAVQADIHSNRAVDNVAPTSDHISVMEQRHGDHRRKRRRSRLQPR